MRPEGTVAIVGLGLIGGSLARELAARGARVLGYDTDRVALEGALAAGAVHQALSPALDQLGDADVLVLAVPVPAAPRVLEVVREHLGTGTLIMDVGSTKRSIQAAATTLGLERHFVGAHPLAGDHRGGWSASRLGLFVGSRVLLCPAPAAGQPTIQRALELWQKLGATPQLTTAEEHDRMLACTSHLPQATAFLLAHALAAAGVRREWLGPGGRDTLRLAASPPPLWTGIALDNADYLLSALAALQSSLAELEQALQRRDASRLDELFASGHHWYTSD